MVHNAVHNAFLNTLKMGTASHAFPLEMTPGTGPIEVLAYAVNKYLLQIINIIVIFQGFTVFTADAGRAKDRDQSSKERGGTPQHYSRLETNV